MSQLYTFWVDESGAVTVDWVVLTGAMAGVGLTAAAVMNTAVVDLASDFADIYAAQGIGLGGGSDDDLQARSDAWGSANRVTNGSFETIEGLINAGWGLYSADGRIDGWDTLSENGPELIASGYNGIIGTDGDWMLDLEGSAGNVTIGQTIPDAVDGEVYRLTLDAADAVGTNEIQVIWGGNVVQTIRPSVGVMSNYTIDMVGGAGDGSNTVLIAGLGIEDNEGAYIDNVSVARVETPDAD